MHIPESAHLLPCASIVASTARAPHEACHAAMRLRRRWRAISLLSLWFSQLRIIKVATTKAGTSRLGRYFMLSGIRASRRGSARWTPLHKTEFLMTYSMRAHITPVRSELATSGANSRELKRFTGRSAETITPNQAMQLTASNPAVFPSGVCHRHLWLCGPRSGLAAADLVSR